MLRFAIILTVITIGLAGCASTDPVLDRSASGPSGSSEQGAGNYWNGHGADGMLG
jgi:hypothetical protein